MSTQETNMPQAIELPPESFGIEDLRNFPQVEAQIGQTEGVIQFQIDLKSFDKRILEKHTNENFISAYDTRAATRGRCLIINNKKFKGLDERTGTDVDCTNLNNLFTQLGYQVDVLSDQTAEQMKVACSKFILDPIHEFHVTCVLIILSHGSMGKIYGSDCESVDEQTDILDLFNHKDCRLNGKPKLLIVQACRTQLGTEDKATEWDPENFEEKDGDSEEDDFVDLLALMCKLNKKDSDAVGSHRTKFSDLLIAHSTLPGFESRRNINHGSWFVQCLVRTFSEHFFEEHVADMLVMVNAEMSRIFGRMPQPINQLCKKFYFFPPSE